MNSRNLKSRNRPRPSCSIEVSTTLVSSQQQELRTQYRSHRPLRPTLSPLSALRDTNLPLSSSRPRLMSSCLTSRCTRRRHTSWRFKINSCWLMIIFNLKIRCFRDLTKSFKHLFLIKRPSKLESSTLVNNHLEVTM